MTPEEEEREKREKQLRREQEKRARAEEKAQRKQKRIEDRNENAVNRVRSKKTSAYKESFMAMRFMFFSSLILLVIFVMFEILLFFSSGGSWGDLNTHLLNMADNTLAFVIGLGAMDLITFYNQVGRRKREELRAIVRHNRLLEPNIDMFITRKNALTTLEGQPIDQYTVIKDTSVSDFADMFEPSSIASDAGISKLDMYAYHQKYLFKSFEKMIEDIDFSFNPDACEAAMDFINATVYGSSSLQALAALQSPENKTKRNALVKAIKAADDESTADTNPELMSVIILKQTIRDQERALSKYLSAVKDIEDN